MRTMSSNESFGWTAVLMTTDKRDTKNREENRTVTYELVEVVEQQRCFWID